MSAPIRILHLDDNPSDAQLVAITLEIEQEKFPTTLKYVQTREEFLAALSRKDFDIILSDFRMSGYDGDDALASAKEVCPEIPFIMVTGELGEEFVIERLQRGATDYVLKDRIFRLIPAIKRALTEAENSRKRKEAESEIKRRQGELWAIIQAMHGGVTVLDMQGNVVLVNEAEVEMLGYKHASELKQSLAYFTQTFEFLDAHGHVVPLGDWPLSHIMHGEVVADRELKARRKDTGQEWFFSFSGQPVWNENGEQILSVIVTRDISERKAQEEALRQSEERFASAFRASPDPFVISLLEDGTILDINESFLDLFGYKREDVVGQSSLSLGMFIDLEDRERAVTLLRERGKLRHFETHIRLRSGEERIAQISAELLELRSEPALLTIMHDVTEQKQMQAALQESEQRVRRKLESILSPEGNLESLELADLVDAPALEKLLTEFHAIAHLPIGVIDIKGKVLVGIGWQNICTQFHRVHPETCKHCIESDTELSAGVPKGEFRLYKCKNNMWDIATPIIVGGHHVGNLFSGQFFFEEEAIDLEFFRAQARQYGFDEEHYLSALESVPRLSRDTVEHGMEFLQNLADTISQLGYSNVKLGHLLAERDRLTKFLHDEQETFKVAQEIAHLGSWYLDLTTNTLTWSAEVYRIFGLEPHQFGATFEAFLDHVHPEDRKLVSEAYAGSVRDDQDTYEVEHRVVRKSTGEIRVVHERCRHIRDSSGKIVRSVGMTLDITERKRAESLIRASEMKYRQLVETANEGISVADPEGHLTFVNDRFATMLGYGGPEELIGKSVFDLVADKEAAHVNLKRRLEGEKANYEFAYLRKDGSRVWALVSATRLVDKDGKVEGTFGMVTDITGRKQMEAALKESEERFHTLADNIPQLAWMTDEKGWIFWYNKRWFDYTGTTLQEMEGWGWQQVHHPEHVERVTEKFRVALVDGQSWEDTFPLRGKDGQYRWFLSRAFPIKNAEGKVTRWFGTNTDITDLKKAEEATLEVALFPEENPSPVLRISHAGILLYANRASKPLLEQLNFKLRDKVPTLLSEPVQSALRKGTSSTFDFKFQDSVVSFLVSPVKERQYANLYGRNVTDQRQMEERLKESEELSRLALAAGRAGVWSWDLKVGTLKWSDEFYRIFGIEPGTIEPRVEEGLMRIHPEDRSHVTALIEKALASGEAIDETHRVLWPDGSLHWVRGMARAFFGGASESKPYRLVGLAIDVTPQREAEERLYELNRDLQKRNWELDAERVKWQRLIEGIADEVWACNVEGKVSMVKFAPNAGTGTTELEGEELTRLLQEREVLRSDGSVRPDDESPLQRSLKGEIVRGEEIVRNKVTGEARIRQHSSVPVRDAEGGITGAAAIVRDITEERTSEAEIRKLNEELEERVTLRTAELERVNKELEAFSYSVSHDLKAPLRLISGFAALLGKQSDAQLTVKQQEFLGTIQEQATHMDELIRALLEFSRVSREEPRLVAVNTRQMVEAVVAEQRNILGGEAGERVLVEIGDLPKVHADPILLRMVFTNLLSNAFKFTRTVAEPKITVEATLRDDYFHFRIADNGVGFPRGQREKLFQVFQRLHAATEFEGSGIGLANVRKIVERHGGKVRADGEEGKGATFFIALPYKA